MLKRTDPLLTYSIYLHPGFKEIFDNRSGECKDGLYPTVTVRRLMQTLKMKPVKRERDWKLILMEKMFNSRKIHSIY